MRTVTSGAVATPESDFLSLEQAQDDLQGVRRALERIAQAIELQALIEWDRIADLASTSETTRELAEAISTRISARGVIRDEKDATAPRGAVWSRNDGSVLIRGYRLWSEARDRSILANGRTQLERLKDGTWVVVTEQDGSPFLLGAEGACCSRAEALALGVLDGEHAAPIRGFSGFAEADQLVHKLASTLTLPPRTFVQLHDRSWVVRASTPEGVVMLWGDGSTRCTPDQAVAAGLLEKSRA